jgi:hypothetical protein
MDPAEL